VGILAPRVPEPVSIIGASGALGFGLALRLARAGCQVAIGSREPDRAQQAAARARQAVPKGSVRGLSNAEAAAANELVVLSVPFRNQSETLHNLRDVLRAGQLVIDATVPLAAAVGGKATRTSVGTIRTLGVWQGSAAQQAQEMVPTDVRVVSALHTVSAATLRDLEHVLDEDVLLAGDRRADKQRAAQLIDAIDGLRCVDVGRLEMARLTESLTALMISINARHKTRAGVRVTGLPDDLWPEPASRP
jgi:NADPH-dependent F420 reductase